CWIGCVRALESVARAISVALPGRLDVLQPNSQSRHAFGFDSPSNFASFQVAPSSPLISTFLISPSPVQAVPYTRTFEFAGIVSPSLGRAISALICISESGTSSALSPRLFQNE